MVKLDEINDDCLLEIAEYLTIFDLNRLLRVNKRLHSVIGGYVERNKDNRNFHWNMDIEGYYENRHWDYVMASYYLREHQWRILLRRLMPSFAQLFIIVFATLLAYYFR